MTGRSGRSTRSSARSVSGSVPTIVGRGDAPVGQLHADLVRALDDVVIGDDVTGRVDDHAGAEAALDALAHGRQILSQQRTRGAEGTGVRRRRAPCRC